MAYKFRITDSGSSNVNYYNIYLDDYSNPVATNVLLPYDVVVTEWKPNLLFLIENNSLTCGSVKSFLINNLTTTTSTNPPLLLTTMAYIPPSTSTTTNPITTTNPPTTTQTTPNPTSTTSTSSTTSSTTQAPNVNVFLSMQYDSGIELTTVLAYLRNDYGVPYIAPTDIFVEGSVYYVTLSNGQTVATPFSLYIPEGYSSNFTAFAIEDNEHSEDACISNITPDTYSGTTFTIITTC